MVAVLIVPLNVETCLCSLYAFLASQLVVSHGILLVLCLPASTLKRLCSCSRGLCTIRESVSRLRRPRAWSSMSVKDENDTCEVADIVRPDGGGDIFVGAALPFGVVKLGIDTHDLPANESANNGGYTPSGNVTGFSLFHESGEKEA